MRLNVRKGAKGLRLSTGIGDLVVLKPELVERLGLCRPWAWCRGFVFRKGQASLDLNGKPVAGSKVQSLIVHVPDEKDPSTNWFYLDEATIPLSDCIFEPMEAYRVLCLELERAEQEPHTAKERGALRNALREVERMAER